LNTKLIIRAAGSLIIIAVLFIFSSCSKTADGNLTEKKADDKEQQMKSLESSDVDEKDFTESDEDLSAVDYKEFYEQLEPHGEWVQVLPEEIGLKPNTAYYESPLRKMNSATDASGKTDVNAGLVYVWKPSAGLSANTGASGQSQQYVPYTNGQWINTDAGWYFKAPTPVEETTSHYGRWVNSPTAGWLWVPGKVWAPAWVDWKQDDSHISWAPLPPSVYVVNNTMSAPVIEESSYVIVERKYFMEPAVYKHNKVYYDNGERIMVSRFRNTEGIVIINNAIVNRGPDVSIFEALFGRPIEIVKIQTVRTYSDIRYNSGEYFVYKHGFKKYKHKDNKWFTVNEPKKYKKYSEWKEVKSDEKEYRKEQKEYEKEVKKNDKENGNNGNNGNNNGRKNDENVGGKKDGKINGSDNGGKKNDKDKEKNDGGKKNNDNKQKDNDNNKGKK
jgi:hypothetical protein